MEEEVDPDVAAHADIIEGRCFCPGLPSPSGFSGPATENLQTSSHTPLCYLLTSPWTLTASPSEKCAKMVLLRDNGVRIETRLSREVEAVRTSHWLKAVPGKERTEEDGNAQPDSNPPVCPCAQGSSLFPIIHPFFLIFS